MMKEDLQAVARLGDGDGKKYDRVLDSDDLGEFYRLNPIAARFEVTDAYFDRFNKDSREAYQELHARLRQAIYLFGHGTQAQFSTKDSQIPVYHRKFFKELARLYPDGRSDMVEDMDIYVFAQNHGLPFSQMVSLSIFREGNGYDFGYLRRYLSYIEGNQPKTTPPFEDEFIYSGRLINIGEEEEITIPFLSEYDGPGEFKKAFTTITKVQGKPLFDEYPRIGLVAPRIIAGVDGRTGYHLQQHQTGVAQAFPISRTTYLFPYAADCTYRLTLDLRDKTIIEKLDSDGEQSWSFTLDLSHDEIQKELRALLKNPFDEAKRDPLYRDNPQLAIDHAFEAALSKASHRPNFDYTGHISLDGITALQERLKEALAGYPRFYCPQILFDLMADALPDVILTHTPLGIIPMEFDSDVPDYAGEAKQQRIRAAFERAVAQIKLFPGDKHGHHQEDYLWTIGSRIRLIKIVPQTELDDLPRGDTKTMGQYNPATQTIYMVDELFPSDKPDTRQNRYQVPPRVEERPALDQPAIRLILRAVADAAVYQMIDRDILTPAQHTKLAEDINKVIIPRIDLDHPMADHTAIQGKKSNGGAELLTNALRLYWTNPDELKRVCEPLYNLFHNLHHELRVESEQRPPINPFTLDKGQKNKLSRSALDEWALDISKFSRIRRR